MRPRTIALLAGVLALLVAPLGLAHYGHYILATMMMYALVGLSLNILIGMGGQISIGHAGFWALGAYAGAIAMQTFGVPFILAIFVGGIVAGAFGALVALPALRVQGHYLAIATLAFALVVQQILFEWESVTGGRAGLFVPRPSLFGYELGSDFEYYYFLLALFLLAAWVTRNLRTSLAGRSLMALKMSPVAAQCAGISRARHIILAFALSAFFTGISGALYGCLIGRLSTETFSLTASLSFLTMAVIGGLGSEVGALLGAAFLALAPEVLRELQDAQMVVYGVVLVLCMQFLPKGLASLGERIGWLRRPK
ncbi:MAG: branched-chain amino acid ABC transporter permease [Burkholderiales bacterium]|nr:MAG: branched-chain amino acid ABC transporter permease [Burkholderiales bacterium]